MDGRTGEDCAAGHDAIGCVGAWLRRGGDVEHIAKCETRRRQLVVRLSNEVRNILPVAATAGTFESDVSRRLRDAEAD